MSQDQGSTRPRKAVGPDRPSYFDGQDVDRVMGVLLALISEVASIRERLDAHERVGASGNLPAVDLIESYLPDAVAEADRESWREGYIRRLFRVITEDVDALRAAAKQRDGAE